MKSALCLVVGISVSLILSDMAEAGRRIRTRYNRRAWVKHHQAECGTQVAKVESWRKQIGVPPEQATRAITPPPPADLIPETPPESVQAEKEREAPPEQVIRAIAPPPPPADLIPETPPQSVQSEKEREAPPEPPKHEAEIESLKEQIRVLREQATRAITPPPPADLIPETPLENRQPEIEGETPPEPPKLKGLLNSHSKTGKLRYGNKVSRFAVENVNWNSTYVGMENSPTGQSTMYVVINGLTPVVRYDKEGKVAYYDYGPARAAALIER